MENYKLLYFSIFSKMYELSSRRSKTELSYHVREGRGFASCNDIYANTLANAITGIIEQFLLLFRYAKEFLNNLSSAKEAGYGKNCRISHKGVAYY